MLGQKLYRGSDRGDVMRLSMVWKASVTFARWAYVFKRYVPVGKGQGM